MAIAGREFLNAFALPLSAAPSSREEKAEAPILAALEKGDTMEVNRLLERHMDVGAVNKFGQTTLHVVALKERVDTLEALLRKGSLETLDQDGETVIHSIDFSNISVDSMTSPMMVECLLSAGADPEAI